MAHKVYIAESLRLGAENKYLKASFWDIVHPPEKVDAEAAIADVIASAGVVIR